ncbi:hypothetical protein GF386_06220 [Candidatus Pacearchaeota archaeon]|nr:hypothetical protein [Candidatus Pacearchaeota archaeon]MBD3283684.1 hypothetical protein [Candidatus Pacearchaeota archaeon]
MKKKLGVTTIILIILLSIRIIGQLVIAALNWNMPVLLISYLIFSIAYIVSLIGIILNKKWGPIIAIVIAIIDILASLLVGGLTALGAGIYDLIILFLAFIEFKRL